MSKCDVWTIGIPYNVLVFVHFYRLERAPGFQRHNLHLHIASVQGAAGVIFELLHLVSQLPAQALLLGELLLESYRLRWRDSRGADGGGMSLLITGSVCISQ